MKIKQWVLVSKRGRIAPSSNWSRKHTLVGVDRWTLGNLVWDRHYWIPVRVEFEVKVRSKRKKHEDHI